MSLKKRFIDSGKKTIVGLKMHIHPNRMKVNRKHHL